MIRLHINIDHVATLRNVRDNQYPDPVFAAQLCEQAGADGITMHLREDRRHIRDTDVERARSVLSTVLNLEMAANPEMLEIAERIVPDVVTLVPERREERTTEGGLNVTGNHAMIARIAEMCRTKEIKLSLFIEPEIEQIRASVDLGATQVEFHTGAYAGLRGEAQARELSQLAHAAQFAGANGLEVAAGHGLTQHNVVAIAAISQLVEVNIGHAVISDALMVGLPQTIAGFRSALNRGEGLRTSNH
jgi:pyridoxine 5-phosphate synthase